MTQCCSWKYEHRRTSNGSSKEVLEKCKYIFVKCYFFVEKKVRILCNIKHTHIFSRILCNAKDSHILKKNNKKLTVYLLLKSINR